MAHSAFRPCLCTDIYQNERLGLNVKQIDEILLAGRVWDLSKTLSSGGVVVFPHSYLLQCGAYIAAAVHGALDSGCDHVVVLGVLHSFSDELHRARAKEKAGADLSNLALRAVHGPRMKRGDYWKDEYSLLSFIFLWKEEVKRRGIKPPRLSIRYPYLVNCQPETLPGIGELENLVKDACLIATSDFCHHGAAYGIDKENTLTANAANVYAKKSIEDHLMLLQEGDLAAFYQHCQKIRSDSFDVGTIIYHLKGPLCPSVLDVTLIDTSDLYEGTPEPSWVAASLVKLEKGIR